MNRKSIFLALLTVLLALTASTAVANIIYVNADGTGDYSTIQAAINAALNGDTVLVADGTYARAFISGSIHGNKTLTIRSENGPENCVIDGQGEWGFWFYRTGTTNCRLEGFTVSNCQYDFGAIYCSEGSSPTVTNCIVTNNGNPRGVPHYRGIAGIRCDSASSPTISNCLIIDNYFRAGDNGVGGGIFCAYSCNPTVINCTIVDNTSYNEGGAIYCKNNCNIKISNCIFWANSPNEIILVSGSTASVTYSNVQGGWPGEGNINFNPNFVDPNNGDYHLSEDSPCIDAGTDVGVYEDIEGNVRPFDYPDVDNNGDLPEFDMGAYEAIVPPIEVAMKFTPQALNPGSGGKWVKAHFVLAEGFAVEDVDANTPAEIEQLDIESEYMNVFINEDGFVEIEAAFRRGDFCGGVDFGPAEVTVIGRLTSGQYFCGTDTIRIITNKLGYVADLASYWLRADCGPPDWCGGLDVDQDSIVDWLDFAMSEGCCIKIIRN